MCINQLVFQNMCHQPQLRSNFVIGDNNHLLNDTYYCKKANLRFLEFIFYERVIQKTLQCLEHGLLGSYNSDF